MEHACGIIGSVILVVVVLVVMAWTGDVDDDYTDMSVPSKPPGGDDAGRK